ncbi:amino acid adenylation domain-containing protein [uncultured Bradyrhizobium sp.]|uniref:amino acid adenylation domain-containing protein n=1 Tax=uncultured Bradyrhizobium sp. TaxID=199684 RepID=UPI0035CA5AC0
MQRNAFVEQFELMAETHPDAVAVRTWDRSIDYRRLNQAANRIAHDILRRSSAQAGEVTGLFMDPGIDYVAGLLGAAKAGTAFLPLPPALPERRLATQMDKAAPRHIVTDPSNVDRLSAALGATSRKPEIVVADTAADAGPGTGNPGLRIAPGDPCYVMFTSGSTGAPKAILGQQRGLSHFLRWEIDTFALDARCRCSWLAPSTFDVSLRDVLVPLMTGGTLCIPEADTRVLPHRLVDWLAATGVTLVHIVPTMLRMIVRELQRRQVAERPFPALRHLLVAGEPLLAGDIRAWREIAGTEAEVVNLYGPTETTLAKMFHRITALPEDPGKILPVGLALPNTAALIVNGNRLCRPGEIGEIHIQTPYRSLGYLGEPELTAASFIFNPLSNEPDDVVYKTGDLGRYLPDGAVECLGRMDNQIKINGVRIELAEVEAALRGVAGIDQAVVAVHAGINDQPCMVGYYTRSDNSTEALATAAIQAEMNRTLPAGMQPHFFMVLAELPQTISGKVNRKALPRPDELIHQRIPFVAPEGELEQGIARVWSELFGIARVGATAAFRELGGDSLKAIRAVMRIWEETGVEIALKDFFERSTVRDLAAFIALHRNSGSVLPIPRLEKARSYPTSPGQQRLWRLDRMGIAATAYNLAEAYLLEGALDAAALEQAFTILIARHEALRTTFGEDDGELRQVVQDHLPWQIERHDLSERPDAADAASQLAEAERNRAFDLANGPLLRVGLARLPAASDGRERHLFLFNIHHIVSDLWSLDVLVRDLAQLYRDCRRGKPLQPELPLQYRDVVAWQKQRQAAGEFATARNYWIERFRTPPGPLELPVDRPRPPLQRFNGSTERFEFGPELSAALAGLAERRGVTIFVLLTALLKALLHRYTGQRDIAVGTTTAGRDHPAMAPLIGYLATTVVLRDDVDSAAPFAGLLSAVARTVAEAQQHQNYPFDALIGELALERDMSRSPLFDVMIIEQAFDAVDLVLDGIAASPFGPQNAWAFSRYDMVFHFQRAGDGLVLDLNYNTDLYDAPRIRRCGEHFQQLAWSATLAPDSEVGDLSLLTGAEHGAIAKFEQGPVVERPAPATITSCFSAAAARFSDRAALAEPGREISYGALATITDDLALHLAGALGIVPGDRVAVLAERSIASVTAMLAIVKAGAVYVPIDPALPAARMVAMARRADCRLVLADPALRIATPRLGVRTVLIDDLIAAAHPRPNSEAFKDRSAARDVAYVIFTSGSTGEPRGVMVEHAGFVNMSLGQIEALGLDATDRVVQFASPSFDASLANMFMALFAGGTVLLPPSSALQSLPVFLEYLAVSKATVVTLPPTYLRALERAQLSGIRTLISAGEAAPSGEMAHYATQLAAFNAYGPTEFSVCATMHAVHSGLQPPRVPIGQPLPNTSLHIFDARLRRVPIGIDGEIFLGGLGVARGYQNEPEQTAAKFVRHPDTGARLYRTGDRARWLSDGSVDFLGRRDEQVKVSGHRIELGEVEQAMRAVEWLRDAHVAPHLRGDGSTALIGYYVPEPVLELWPSIAEFFVYDDVTYGRMAADENRNRRYRTAFARHLPGKVVVDVGTGPMAILAQLAVAAGARKVYAIDLLEQTAAAARRTVAELGLSDRIEVIQGDAAAITLPEPADWCISEIVGAIGGSEGAAAIINGARRLLADPANMLPRRSLTLIAAVSIDDDVASRGFSDIAAHYVERIFEAVGRPFDLRLCLKNLPDEAIVSTEAPFEDLDYTKEVPLNDEHRIVLRITQASRITGFVVWLRLFVDTDLVVDILESPASWIPVYLPALPQGIDARPGDCIRLNVERHASFTGRNPDFRITGVIERPGRESVEVDWTSAHIADGFRHAPFYERLFAEGRIPRSPSRSVVDLRRALGERLPPYAVPAFLVEIDRIPMTVNGKVDRTALPLPLASAQARRRPPRSKAELAVVEAWQKVLEREEIGLDDDFFQLGGDSIHAIRIVSELRLHGWRTEIRDVFQNPTPEHLAATAVSVAADDARFPVIGEVPLSPIQRWLFDTTQRTPSHFNQAVVLRSDAAFDTGAVAAALTALWRQHDALRAKFNREGGTVIQVIGSPDPVELLELLPNGEALAKAAGTAQAGFSLSQGPLMKGLLASGPAGGELLLIAHHAIVDAVSWRVLIEDFATAYAQAHDGVAPDLGPLSTSVAQYASALQRLATQTDWSSRIHYWRTVSVPPALPADLPVVGVPMFGDLEQVSLVLDQDRTEALLANAQRDWGTGTEELLLAALGSAVARVFERNAVLVTLEGHGREAPIDGDLEFPDLGRTVGWFTNFFPLLLTRTDAAVAQTIEEIHSALRRMPDRGRTYGLLTRHPSGPKLPAVTGQIGFNFLGNFGASRIRPALSVDWNAPGGAIAPDMPRPHALDVIAMVTDGRLELTIDFDKLRYRRQTAERLLSAIVETLTAIAEGVTDHAGHARAKDFTYGRFSADQIDQLLEAD